MPRPARFSHEQMIAATTRVAAKRGPSGATVARIAQALGAPTGSIYHRFASRNVLLGEVWLRAAESFQDGFGERLAGSDGEAAGLAAVCYVPQWVRAHPQEARILLLHRREDFLEHGWPEQAKARAKALRRQLSEGLHNFCQRVLGSTDHTTLRIAAFALAEAPLAAVRQHVEVGEPPPPIVDAMIEETYRASISLCRAQQ